MMTESTDFMQYGTYQISKKEFDERQKKKKEYISNKLEVKKTFRKFKQKTMFGSKELNEVYLDFNIENKKCLYLNGNIFDFGKSASIREWFSDNKWESDESINWIAFGLFEKGYNYAKINCCFNGNAWVFPLSPKFLYCGYDIKWKEGVNKYAIFQGELESGIFNGIIWERRGQNNMQIKDFLHGYNQYNNSFLGKDTKNAGEYEKIEIYEANIGDYIIIEDENLNKQGFRLSARYLYEYTQMKRGLINFHLLGEEENPKYQLRFNKDIAKKRELFNSGAEIEWKIKKAITWLEKANKTNDISNDDVAKYIEQLYCECYDMSKITLCIQHIPTMKDYFVDWHDIIWDYERFGVIKVGKPYELPGVFKIEKVKSIQILEEFKFIPKLNETFDLNIEPRFELNNIISFSFTKVDDRDTALEFFEHIKNKEFFEKIIKIKNLYKDGYIEGYYNILELKEIFNNIQGKPNLPENKDVVEHLKYLQLFYEYFIDNIKDSSEREAVIEAIKQIINSKANSTITSTKVKGLISDSIDFSVDERLGINLTISFNFNTKDEQEKFNRIKETLATGELYSKIDDISKLRRKGYIEGYYIYLELKELFNNIQGSDKLPDDSRVKNAFEFLLNVQHNLIDKTDNEDSASLLTNMLKLLIND